MISIHAHVALNQIKFFIKCFKVFGKNLKFQKKSKIYPLMIRKLFLRCHTRVLLNWITKNPQKGKPQINFKKVNQFPWLLPLLPSKKSLGMSDKKKFHKYQYFFIFLFFSGIIDTTRVYPYQIIYCHVEDSEIKRRFQQ